MKSSVLFTILTAGLVLGLTACSTNRQMTKGVEPSGFLGDYSQMEKGGKGLANLRYIKPGMNWTPYTKIWIKPIEIWKSDDPESRMSKISPENRQQLADLFHTALHDTLQGSYTMVEQGGPDVLILHAAITDAKQSKPVAGAVSSIYLPLKVISLGKQELAGTAIGVGSVTIEGELLDGASNQRLAAVVDSRSGTTALRSKFRSTWGDVHESFKWWAERLQTRLAEEKAGASVKTPL